LEKDEEEAAEVYLRYYINIFLAGRG